MTCAARLAFSRRPKRSTFSREYCLSPWHDTLQSVYLGYLLIHLLLFMPPSRIVCSRQLSPTDIPRIPSRMLRAVNTAIVASDAAQEANQWWFSSLCLAGSMSDRVLIKVSADADSGKVAVDVYSDSTLLPSKLTGPIKKALEGHRRS